MFAAFVFAAMLAAGILKVLGYVDWSWWLISSPLIAWMAFQLVIVSIYLVVRFLPKKEIPRRPVPKSGFAKRLEEAQRAQREAEEKRKQERM